MAGGLNHVVTDGWASSAGSLDALGEPLFRVAAGRHEQALFERDGVLVEASVAAGHVRVTVAGRHRGAVEAALESVRALFPVPDPSSSHEVALTFWTYGSRGPSSSWRSITVPAWQEIAGNYADATRRELEALMVGFRPAHGGQLILWHGLPGTGKTFALRALAWEWREWCTVHYIVDPDSFFGQHADYLMSVLLDEQAGPFAFAGGAGAWVSFPLGEDGPDGEEARPQPWRLLVLEDAGELIAADARAAAGQGLSRFLNVVDGLIGQGLRILVLVTTNEELRRLHPAVARAGRCAANVEFAALSTAEARAWLAARGSAEAVSETSVLASLYARLEGRDPDDIHSVGFAG